MSRLWIGIDPGLNGAIGFVAEGRDAWVEPMPTLPYSATGVVKRAFDPHGLAGILRPHIEALEWDRKAVSVVIERVNAFPGQGVASMFSLGMSYWGAFSVCATLGIPVQMVEPKDWKRFFRLEKDKALARAMAQRLFPHLNFGKVKDDGRAEALLIAQYGKFLENK